MANTHTYFLASRDNSKALLVQAGHNVDDRFHWLELLTNNPISSALDYRVRLQSEQPEYTGLQSKITEKDLSTLGYGARLQKKTRE